jgi:hypothetical protein
MRSTSPGDPANALPGGYSFVEQSSQTLTADSSIGMESRSGQADA